MYSILERLALSVAALFGLVCLVMAVRKYRTAASNRRRIDVLAYGVGS